MEKHDEDVKLGGPIGAVNPNMQQAVMDAVLACAKRIGDGETVAVAIVEVNMANEISITEGRLAKNVLQTLCYGIDKMKFRMHMRNEFNVGLFED